MDEAIRQARAARESAADFFNANPTRHYVGMGGVVYTSDGRVIQPPAEGATQPLPPDMTAAEAHRIAGERGQALYVTPEGDTLCADSSPPGAVRVWVGGKA